MATVTLDNNEGKKGFLISAIIHTLLFLVLFFIVLDSPPKQDVTDAVILDFGDSDAGGGRNSGFSGGGSAPIENKIVESQPIQSTISQPKIQSTTTSVPKTTPTNTTVSSYDANAVAIQNQQKLEAAQKKQELIAQQKLEEQRKKEAAELLKKQQEEQATKDAVASAFQKGKNSGGTGGTGNGSGSGVGNSTGNGNGSGGKGNSGGSSIGDGNGGGGSGGSGGGIGTNYSLSGRSLISKKVPFNNSQKGGVIVIQIKVDQNGQVIFAQGPYKGSTTTDAYLVKISEDAAKNFKFSANSDAAEEQFGTITFNYTFN